MTQKSESGDWLNDDKLASGEELGDDWESAFQAEDFEFSPDDKNELFPDGPGAAAPYEFTPPDETELASLPDLGQDSEKEGADGPLPPFPAEEGRAGLFKCLWQTIRQRSAALPLIHKLLVGGCSLLGLILLLSVILALQSRFTQVHEPLPLLSPSPPADPADITFQPEPVLQRWKFESFLLPIAAEPPGKTVFLEVELTLLLVLAPDEEFPYDQKIRIRDLIFQFYNQQPQDALRRFALARGEMTRSLLAWLREHWPGAPLETIIFNRYQIR